MTRTPPAHIKTSKAGCKKKKGTSGAAKNYITRNQALKKLQCTLSDFRRLCILKGIYPREPRNRKKANRGSTAPASFYYAKDIAYLLHEPVLQKLRDHKAFAKKLSRALGRKEDGLAKNLDSAHEGYRIDHIIKERYPVFADSVRDLDDALSLIILFANLPATNHVSPKVIANCARLAAEWQIYVIKSKSLRKVFLSIKGIYYQAEVEGQRVTWLVPYPFTQVIPADIDFRIMLTFLELYQTLLGFVFFRLFQTINLIYPPKLDAVQDEAAAGMGALILENTTQILVADQSGIDSQLTSKSAKSVRNQIKSIITSQTIQLDETANEEQMEAEPIDQDHNDSEQDDLFKTYMFFISREVTRPMLEFVIRCAGGQVGWDPTLGAGSPFLESDARVTHHVIDRPVLPPSTKNLPQRAFIQPQWVVDCLNQEKLLPTEDYGPGKTLPPHLSPFVDDDEVRRQGGYVSEAAKVQEGDKEMDDEPGSEGSQSEEGGEDGKLETVDKPEENKTMDRPALRSLASDPQNLDLIHAAEIEAERLGISHDKFEEDLKKSIRQSKPKVKNHEDDQAPMAEMMLTGKQRKLYKKMNYTKQKRSEERTKLENKKKALDKKKKQI